MSNTSESAFTCNPWFRVNPNSPTNAEPCEWLYFSYFSGIIAGLILLFGLLAVVLSVAFFLLRKCGLCGGSKPQEAYEESVQNRHTFFYSFIAFSIVLVALTGVGAGTFLTIGVTQTVQGLASSANKASVSLRADAFNLSDIIPAVPALSLQFENFTKSLEPVLTDSADVSSISATQVIESENSVRLATEEAGLLEREIQHLNEVLLGYITSSPLNLSRVITTNIDLYSQLNLQKTLGLLQNQTMVIENTAIASQNDTSALSLKINEAKDLLNGYPRSAVDSFEYTIGFFNSTVSDLLDLESSIRQYLSTSRFQDAVNYVFVTIGVLFVSSLFIIMISYFIFALLGTTRVRSVGAMKCSALCSVFSVLWFCLCACVLVGLTMVNISYCKNGRNEILNPDLLSSDFVESHMNYSRMLNLTYGILKCEYGQSLVDVALRLNPGRNVSFLDPRFNNYTYTALDDVYGLNNVASGIGNNGQKVVDQSQYLFTVLQNILDAFNGNLNDFVKNNVLVPASNDNLYEIDNPIVLSSFDSMISDINNITSNKLDLFYVRSNISLFDSSVYVNNSRLTAEENSTLSSLDTRITPMSQVYFNIVTLRTQISDWMVVKTSSQTYLNNLQFPVLKGAFMRVSDGGASLVKHAQSVQTNLRYVDTTSFEQKLYAVTNHTNEFIRETQCYAIGDGAREFENNVCRVVLPSLILSCVAAFLIAFLLFTIFPLSLITSKKYASGYSSENVSLLEESNSQRYGRSQFN